MSNGNDDGSSVPAPQPHDFEVIQLWNLFVNDQGYYEGTVADIAMALGWSEGQVHRELLWVRTHGPEQYNMTIPHVGPGAASHQWRFVMTDGSEVLSPEGLLSVVKGQLSMHRMAFTSGGIRLDLAYAILKVPGLSEAKKKLWKKWAHHEEVAIDNYESLVDETQKELSKLLDG